MKFRNRLLGTLLSYTFCVFFMAGCASNLSEFSLINNSDEEVSPFQHGRFIDKATQSTGRDLGIYTRNIITEMTSNMVMTNENGIIAVTHFTNASSDYNSTGDLGFALGESFLRELHQFGFRTLDYKVSDAIRVTMEGDFALTRDFMELKNEVPAEYVLVGTIIEQQQGFVVNARIVELSTKSILATGKSFIPRSAVNMLVTYSSANSIN